MKIKTVRPIALSIPVRYAGKPLQLAGAPWRNQEIVLVEIRTESGAVGYGEAYCIVAGIRNALVSLVNDMIAPLLVGQNAADIAGVVTGLQRSVQPFGRYGLMMAAVSGVDIALWDIAGKVANQPLSRLLGGYQEALPSAASLVRTGDASELARKIEEAMAAGYKAVKIHENDLGCIAAARSAAGPDTRMSVDINCSWDLPYAQKALSIIGEARPYFVEDPIWPPENLKGLARLRAQSGLLIATGGTSCTAWEFQNIFDADAADFCQPSVTVVGGVTEVQKIAHIARTRNVALSLHTPYFGPGLLASLHLAAAYGMTNEFERPFYALEADPYGGQFLARAGASRVPKGPGLGADPDPAVIERYAVN
ncbi:MAG: mandelate racemase/muconate lactonizing enzyme family protein [Reyranellaceae bacterium]